MREKLIEEIIALESKIISTFRSFDKDGIDHARNERNGYATQKAALQSKLHELSPLPPMAKVLIDNWVPFALAHGSERASSIKIFTDPFGDHDCGHDVYLLLETSNRGTFILTKRLLESLGARVISRDDGECPPIIISRLSVETLNSNAQEWMNSHSDFMTLEVVRPKKMIPEKDIFTGKLIGIRQGVEDYYVVAAPKPTQAPEVAAQLQRIGLYATAHNVPDRRDEEAEEKNKSAVMRLGTSVNDID